MRKSIAILLKHFQVEKCVYLLHCYTSCFKCEDETGQAVPDDTLLRVLFSFDIIPVYL